MKSNISKQNKDERMSFHSEALFSDLSKANKLIQAIPDLVFIVNIDGDILFAKPGKDVSLAFPLSEVLGKNLADLPFSSELLKLFISNIKQCLIQGVDIVYTYCLDIGNEKTYYEARNSVFDDKHVLVIIRNRTDEELYKLKISENEKKLLTLNEKLNRRNEKYKTLNEQFQKNNISLISRNSDIETLLKKNHYQEKILHK
jgi:PAS domain-containing protein